MSTWKTIANLYAAPGLYVNLSYNMQFDKTAIWINQYKGKDRQSIQLRHGELVTMIDGLNGKFGNHMCIGKAGRYLDFVFGEMVNVNQVIAGNELKENHMEMSADNAKCLRCILDQLKVFLDLNKKQCPITVRYVLQNALFFAKTKGIPCDIIENKFNQLATLLQKMLLDESLPQIDGPLYNLADCHKNGLNIVPEVILEAVVVGFFKK